MFEPAKFVMRALPEGGGQIFFNPVRPVFRLVENAGGKKLQPAEFLKRSCRLPAMLGTGVENCNFHADIALLYSLEKFMGL